MGTNVGTTLCRASLNYVARDVGTGGGLTDVTILDGRTSPLPGWSTTGFELLDHESAVGDWSNDGDIAEVHYAEVATLAERLSGCDRALVSGHIKRNPARAAQHGDLAPITLVHSDFADSYGELIRERYRDPGPEAVEALSRAGISAEAAAGAARVLILQFWRNIGPAKMDLPLAFCDARTVPRSEIRAFPVTNYAGGGINFDALGVVAPTDLSAHAWYGFDEMQPDEVVAFRTYDSDLVDTDAPYWTPHSAYRDPTVELGNPSRESIELRAICLFL